MAAGEPSPLDDGRLRVLAGQLGSGGLVAAAAHAAAMEAADVVAYARDRLERALNRSGVLPVSPGR